VLENSIEKHLREGVESAGGLCEKFRIVGRRGPPDRLITWPGGAMELVETKAPGKKPRRSQIRDHARRAKLGVRVYVLDTIEKVDRYLRRGNP
jgi:hypothetical protein